MPLTQLGAIQQSTLDWAVAGHLIAKERITEFSKQLKPSERTLREQLNEILNNRFGIQLTKDDWAQTTIPNYLHPRIQVQSAKGKVLASERNLNQLHKTLKTNSKIKSFQNNLTAIPAWQQTQA